MYACLKCSTEKGASYDSVEGSAECDRCVADTYWDEGGGGGGCIDKPEGVVVDEPGTTLEKMKLKPGYFRFSAMSTEVYQCHHYWNCKGGKIRSNSTAIDSLCRKGSRGPLCSICADNYYMSDYSGCQSCGIGNAWLGPLVFVVILLLCAAVAFCYQEKLKDLYNRFEHKLMELSQKATIAFVTMQILIILNTTHKSVGGKEVPSPYLDFLALTGFTTLDVVSLVPFDCMYETSFDHFHALLLESLVPLVLLVVALMYTSARKLRSAALPSHKVLSAWLSMLFLVLPVISRRVCQSFRCEEYHVQNGESVRYLSADSGIDCASARYDWMTLLAACMVIIYPIGAPLLLFVLLFKYRARLNPPNKDEHEVIEARKEDPVLASEPVTAFSMLYRPRFWAFEIYNMIRRLLLTCAVLMCDDLAQTTVFVTVVAIVTLVIEQETKPYCWSFLSAFCNVCCWQIVLFALYLLLLDSNMTSGNQAVAISALLMLANVALIITIFVETRVQSDHNAESVSRRVELQAQVSQSHLRPSWRFDGGSDGPEIEIEMADRKQRLPSFVNPLWDKAAPAVVDTPEVEVVEMGVVPAQSGAASDDI